MHHLDQLQILALSKHYLLLMKQFYNINLRAYALPTPSYVHVTDIEIQSSLVFTMAVKSFIMLPRSFFFGCYQLSLSGVFLLPSNIRQRKGNHSNLSMHGLLTMTARSFIKRGFEFLFRLTLFYQVQV